MKKYVLIIITFYWIFMLLASVANADIVVKHRNNKGQITKVEVLPGISAKSKSKKQLKDIAYEHCTDEGILVLVKYNNRVLYGTKCWEDDND